MAIKRVGIIGAGPAGLAAIKSCLEEGFEPSAFERQDQLGGTWVYRETVDQRYPEAAAVYRCLKTNTSKAVFGYTDYPPPRDWTPFVGHRRCLEYFQNYAKAFGLVKYIRYNAEVIKLYPTDDYETTGRWRLTFRSSGDAAPTEEVFDAVMICTGFYSHANLPVYPGQELFHGDISTGNSYRENSKYRNKRVLVVGSGISGGDIATDISNTSNQAFISSRNGFYLTPVLDSNGWPFDVYLSRRFVHYFAPKYEMSMLERESRKRFRAEEFGLFPPKPGQQSIGTIINDNFINQVSCGKLIPKPGIKSFTKTGVIFSDGSQLHDLDSVVFCTGYRNTIPFVDDSRIPDPLGERDLYSYVFPVKMTHQTLACVGFFKNTTSGSPVTVLEMQTRWVVQVWKENCSLPSKQEMLKAVQRKSREHYKQYGKELYQISAIPYMDTLATRMGCYPPLLAVFFSDPRLAIHMLLSPVVPASYRLVGPHSWKGARASILNSWNSSFEGTLRKTTKGRLSDVFQVVKFLVFASIFIGLVMLLVLLLT